VGGDHERRIVELENRLPGGCAVVLSLVLVWLLFVSGLVASLVALEARLSALEAKTEEKR
jgi:hypothetical protein